VALDPKNGVFSDPKARSRSQTPQTPQTPRVDIPHMNADSDTEDERKSFDRYSVSLQTVPGLHSSPVRHKGSNDIQEEDESSHGVSMEIAQARLDDSSGNPDAIVTGMLHQPLDDSLKTSVPDILLVSHIHSDA